MSASRRQKHARDQIQQNNVMKSLHKRQDTHNSSK